MSVFTSPGSGGPTLVCTDTCTMHGFSLAGALQEELQNDVTMVEFPDNGPTLSTTQRRQLHRMYLAGALQTDPDI